ncbi:MAG TPA: DoxX family membrane protein, partial [Gammaproteobacteria bacterium]|nr:DoxX family membrane protein [Gammaproteobacteria bacterium]
MKKFINKQLHRISMLKVLDFIPLLAIRMYLVPVFYVGAKSKLFKFDATVAWMGGPVVEGGLGLPFPTLMVFVALV